jgi:glycosyltransferase involved in cell wall biosynthesis
LRFLRKLLELKTFLDSRNIDWVYYYFAQTKVGLIKDLAVMWIITGGNRKVMLHLRGGNFRRFYDGESKVVQRLVCHNLSRGHKIMVQSECLKEMFDGIVPPQKLGVLYNGLEQDEIGRTVQLQEVRPLNVFFLGQLSYAKGYFDLLLAIPRIIAKIEDVRFFFAGERISLAAERNILLHYIRGEESPKAIVKKAKAIERDYAPYMEYLGVIDASTREKALSRTSLFVMPTYSEGFSNAVLEAMGFGLPVITTPVGAHQDIFRDTPEILVAPGNAEDLADKVVRILKDPLLMKKYGSHNRRLAKERYSMDVVAEQFLAATEDTP